MLPLTLQCAFIFLRAPSIPTIQMIMLQSTCYAAWRCGNTSTIL